MAVNLISIFLRWVRQVFRIGSRKESQEIARAEVKPGPEETLKERPKPEEEPVTIHEPQEKPISTAEG